MLQRGVTLKKILAVLIATMAVLLGATGLAGASPTTTTCTDWLPPRNDCALVYATVGNDLDPWYTSNSYARRTQTGWHPNGCLNPAFRVRLRYIRQDGSIMWDSGPSPYGSCGQTYNADSGSTYVKVQFNLHYSGCTNCKGTHGVSLYSDSTWW